MEIKEMLQSILEKLSEQMSSTILFGEPREICNKTFIPVTAVSFGFGFGSGQGTGAAGAKKMRMQSSPEAEIGEPSKKEKEPKKNTANTGGGGGGGGKAVPLGMFEISEERTRFIPVISAKHIIILVGFFMLMLHRKR